MKRKVVCVLALLVGGAAACVAQKDQPASIPQPRPLVMLTGKDTERSHRSEIVQRVKIVLQEIGAAQITQDHGGNVPEAMPWRWVLLNESEWMTTARIYGVKTSLAFGDLKQRVTYLRGSRAAAMSSLELKRLLAHELGHLVCACAEQNRAADAADTILKAASLRVPTPHRNSDK